MLYLSQQRILTEKNGVKCIRMNEKSAVLHFPFSKTGSFTAANIIGMMKERQSYAWV